jgi:hypothetical protein
MTGDSLPAGRQGDRLSFWRGVLLRWTLMDGGGLRVRVRSFLYATGYSEA